MSLSCFIDVFLGWFLRRNEATTVLLAWCLNWSYLGILCHLFSYQFLELSPSSDEVLLYLVVNQVSQGCLVHMYSCKPIWSLPKLRRGNFMLIPRWKQVTQGHEWFLVAMIKIFPLGNPMTLCFILNWQALSLMIFPQLLHPTLLIWPTPLSFPSTLIWAPPYKRPHSYPPKLM